VSLASNDCIAFEEMWRSWRAIVIPVMWILGLVKCNVRACDEQPQDVTALPVDCHFSRACGKLLRSGTECEGVGEVDLRDSGLTSLDSGVFSGMSALEKLDLSWNGLGFVPDDSFEGLTRLTELKLHNNMLSTLPHNLLRFELLQKLSISGNPISYLSAELYQELIALQRR
jgi:Leucine-rich repeat (LRR) protein